MSSVSKVCLYREQKYFYELFLSILVISILRVQLSLRLVRVKRIEQVLVWCTAVRPRTAPLYELAVGRGARS
jgi:hypothetical protein